TANTTVQSRLHVAGGIAFNNDNDRNPEAPVGHAQAKATTGVGTTATPILDTNWTGNGTLVTVDGYTNGGADNFVDLLWVVYHNGVFVLHSDTVQGSPASRTYSLGGTNLLLKMGSGSYTVFASGFGS